jgi:biotin operon repressor
MSELNILDGYISRSKLAEQLGKSESTIVRWG